jgi:hypothetical protein
MPQVSIQEQIPAMIVQFEAKSGPPESGLNWNIVAQHFRSDTGDVLVAGGLNQPPY